MLSAVFLLELVSRRLVHFAALLRYYVITNIVQLKTPLDLELNLFENSFANKSLAGTIPQGSDGASSLSSSAPGSKNLVLSSHSVALSLLEKQPSNESLQPMVPTTIGQPVGQGSETSMTSRSLASGGSNKHNLRILNLPNPTNDRMVGLTPPIFTPGGRKLPHLHLLPGLSSPGTSNLWSSLLNVTNGPDSLGQFSHPGYSHLNNMLRKSGLIPTESNLRTGLTPGIMNQTGFNFNLGTPGGMPSGQMTPGFQTLLGLANNASLAENGMLESSQPFQGVPPSGAQQHMHPNLSMPVPGSEHNEQPFGVTQPNIPINKPISEEVILEEPKPVSVEHQIPKGVPDMKAGDDNLLKRDGTLFSEENKSAAKKPKGGSSSKVKTTKGTKSDNKKKAEPEDSEQEKRKKALERNRVAATKCRQRKKRLLNKMESELEFYSSGFRELSLQVSQLRDLLLTLHGVVACHKDCPTLLRAVGGYQQMQAILAQSEYVALIVPNTEANVTSMPSTIPTTLNPVEPLPPMTQGPSMVPQGGPIVSQVGPLPQGPPANGMLPQAGDNGTSMPAHNNIVQNPQMGSTSMGNSGIGTMSSNGLYDMNMGKQFADPYNQGTNLKSCNSTSELQNIKMGQPLENSLRLVVSMADIPGQIPIKSEHV